jgi:hypothetical protein
VARRVKKEDVEEEQGIDHSLLTDIITISSDEEDSERDTSIETDDDAGSPHAAGVRGHDEHDGGAHSRGKSKTAAKKTVAEKKAAQKVAQKKATQKKAVQKKAAQKEATQKKASKNNAGRGGRGGRKLPSSSRENLRTTGDEASPGVPLNGSVWLAVGMRGQASSASNPNGHLSENVTSPASQSEDPSDTPPPPPPSDTPPPPPPEQTPNPSKKRSVEEDRGSGHKRPRN